MDDFCGILHSTPPVEADAPVMVPGEREINRMVDARNTGFDVDAETMVRLRELVSE